MQAKKLLWIAAAAAAAMLLLSGCTLVGLAVGGMIDSSLPQQEILPPTEAYFVGWGTPIEIIGSGGQRVAGQFNGLSRISPQDYAAAYHRALGKLDTTLSLPLPGDSLCVITNGFQTLCGQFASADTQGIRLHLPASNTARDVPFRMIRVLSGARGAIPHDTLRACIETHRLPSSTALAVSARGKRVFFPLDSVLQIQVPYKTRGSRIGTVIGLAVDIAVLSAIIVNNNKYDRGHDRGYDEGLRDGRADWNRDHP